MIDLTTKEAYEERIAAYLRERIKTDTCLAEKCNVSTKTFDGIIKYIFSEAKKQSVRERNIGMACIEEDAVYGWAVHYILEDSLNCEICNSDDDETVGDDDNTNDEEDIAQATSPAPATEKKEATKKRPAKAPATITQQLSLF